MAALTQQQLQQLNKEGAEITAKVEAARLGWVSAKNAQQEAKLKAVCDDLKAE